MFLGTFAWSFVYVSLPFHIQRMSPFDPAATLRWTGWILGISPLVTVLTAPLWGRYAGRGDPKKFYAVTIILQGATFFGMAIARTLVELLLSRFLLGAIGAASTFAFIISGRASDAVAVRRQIAAIQSAMTVGQVIGPLVGALAAARFGFRTSFVLGGLILFGCGGLVRWGMPPPSPSEEPSRPRSTPRIGEVTAVAVIVLGASTQVFFLPSVLPQVLPDLGVAPSDTLEAGGVLIFASGVAAALGSMAAPRLEDVMPERRLIVALLIASSAFQAVLGAAGSVWWYGILRCVQILCVAPLFPLVVAGIAQHGGGEAIGVVNSARIGGAFLGPVIATTLLTGVRPAMLYLVLAAVGFGCVPLAMRRQSARSVP